MIPHINRTCDVILADSIEVQRVNVWEVIDDYTTMFEAVVLMVPGRFCVTFKTA